MAVTTFPETFAGEVVRPGDGGYDAARAVWNGMVDRRPAIVVRPANADDVATAVRFGREHEATWCPTRFCLWAPGW